MLVSAMVSSMFQACFNVSWRGLSPATDSRHFIKISPKQRKNRQFFFQNRQKIASMSQFASRQTVAKPDQKSPTWRQIAKSGHTATARPGPPFFPLLDIPLPRSHEHPLCEGTSAAGEGRECYAICSVAGNSSQENIAKVFSSLSYF